MWVEKLFFNKNRTTEEDALYDLLVMLVEKDETENHPLEPAKPLQVLQRLINKYLDMQFKFSFF